MVIYNDEKHSQGAQTLAPFGLRAAQAHLLRCPSSAMLWHGLRWFALHLHPWRPQRGPRDFYHGLLGIPTFYHRVKGATMKKKERKAECTKVARKTKRERYEEDVLAISEFTPKEVTRTILSGAGMVVDDVKDYFREKQ